MKKVLIVLVVLIVIIAGLLVWKGLSEKKRAQNTTPTAEPVVASAVEKLRDDFTWGATIRPYATSNPATTPQQFQLLQNLFPGSPCVRANIEGNMAVNDQLVELSQKNKTKLYLILEENVDFNQDADYATQAQTLAQKIVARYKGKVAYYQLMNELSGVMFTKTGDIGETMDAGYGLKINKKRYDNVLIFTRSLSQEIRKIDPSAQIVMSGHWVLIDPIMKLITDGVDVDIIGWNWGTDSGTNPGVKTVDGYGTMDLPTRVTAAGKKFWIVEANNDNGSFNGKEAEQASYIGKLAAAAYANKNITGYLHFVLTDTNEGGPGGALGLIKLIKNSDNTYSIGDKKPAFAALQKAAAL